MNPASPGRFEQLATLVCGRWEHGDHPAPSLDEIVAAFGCETPPLSRDELVELCLLDQACRGRLGVIARVEEYIERLPELSADIASVIELAYGELRIRRDQGEEVTDGELHQRFPDCFQILRNQLELGDWWNQQTDRGTTSAAGAAGALDPAGFTPGTRFGAYELLELLGQGGMGTVYRARQPQFDREVALKMIRPERLHSAADRQRFRNEVSLVARLDHPRVVPIFDVGEVAGVPYFTMRLMAGGDLQKARLRAGYDSRRAATIIREIAGALHHSHQRGVLHRDIKSSNILLDEAGEPQLSDFGLAAPLDDFSRSPATSAILGTPQYLPPEQLSATIRPPTVAGDIYGLGVVLYELLAGVLPFDNQPMIPLLEAIRRGEPEPPSRRTRSSVATLSLDLERICLKAISRSPADRYDRAAEFADDLQRYLDGKPTRARPLSWWRRRLRWARQHPDVASLAAAIVVIAATLLAVLGIQAGRLRATRESLDMARAATIAQERRAALIAYGAAIRASQVAWEDDDPIEFSRWLDTCRPQPGMPDERGFEWFLLDRYCRPRVERWPLPEVDSRCVRFAPNGLHVAVGGDGQQVRLLDARDGQLKQAWPVNTVIRELAFSTDGKTLAAVGDDGCLRLFSVDPRTPRRQWAIGAKPLRNVAYLGTGTRVVTCDTQGCVRVIATDTGQSIAAIHDAQESLECVAASPDGTWFATGGVDGSIVIRDAVNFEQLHRFSLDERKSIKCLAVSPDGQRIAVGGIDRFLRVAELHRPWRHTWIWQGRHLERPYAVTFSSDGRYVAGCDKNGAVLVERLEPQTAGEPPPDSPRVLRWMAHTGRAYSLAFDPRSERIATVGTGSHVACWSLSESVRRDCFGDTGTHSSFDHSLAFAPDGAWLAVASRFGIEIWDPRSRRLLNRLNSAGKECHHVAVSPDGRWLAAANRDDRRIEVWQRTGSEFRSAWHRDAIDANELSFSATRGTLAVSSWRSDRVELFRVENGTREREIPALQCHAVAYSPDGQSVAYTELDGSRVANPATRPPIKLAGHWNTVRSVCWSPSGRLLATCSEDRRVIVWEPHLSRQRCELVGHRSQAIRGQFIDEERLITLEENGGLLVWHIGLERLLCRLMPVQAGPCFDLAVSPDRRTVACLLQDGRIQLLHLDRAPAAKAAEKAAEETAEIDLTALRQTR